MGSLFVVSGDDDDVAVVVLVVVLDETVVDPLTTGTKEDWVRLDFCNSDNSFRSCICIAFCNDWNKLDPFMIDRIIEAVTRMAPPMTYVPSTKAEMIDMVTRVRMDIGFGGTTLFVTSLLSEVAMVAELLLS